MVHRHERMKLMQTFKHEPVVGSAVVLRCAAALLLVVVIAVIGATGETSDQSVAAVNFHRWQLADRAARHKAVQAAAQPQATKGDAVNARKSSLKQPGGALGDPVRN